MSRNKFFLRWRVLNQELMVLVLRIILKPFIVLRFNVHYQIPREVRKAIRKGCIVLPHHTFSWDPILIAAGLRHGVHWVATEAIFRKKFLKFFMTHIFGAIPKTKNRSDMEMLKLVQGYLELKRPIGIFPEGQQTWDGKGLPAVSGTEKLIRFLKAPVIFVRSEGAFLTKPRWTWGTFRNRIDFRYEIGITEEEVKTMKLSEITEKVASFLDYNEYELQKKRQIPLQSQRRAEYLELSLYTCPKCKNLSTMRSSGNLFSCNSCDYQVNVDPCGFFENRGQKPFFPTPVEWNEWQQSHLVEYFKQTSDGKPLLEDEDVLLMTSKRRRPLAKWGKGKVFLYQDRIEFIPQKREKRVFYVNEITGFNVFKQQSAEFYFKQTLYRLQFSHPYSSAFKWLNLYEIINNLR